VRRARAAARAAAAPGGVEISVLVPADEIPPRPARAALAKMAPCFLTDFPPALTAEVATYASVPALARLAPLCRQTAPWGMPAEAYVRAIKQSFVLLAPVYSARQLKEYRRLGFLDPLHPAPEAARWFC